MTYSRIAWFAGLGVVSASLIASAQNSPPPAPQAYRPGLGDLMTIQPRHIKIALAGREQNWPYAKYELHELQEALDRVVQNWLQCKGLALGGMVDAISKGPMAELSQAIGEKSSEKFVAAYLRVHSGDRPMNLWY